MKKVFFGVFGLLFLCSVSFAASRTTVMKDDNGYVGGSGVASRVSGYVTDGGVTVFEVQSDGSVSGYYTTLNVGGTFNATGVYTSGTSIPGDNITDGTITSDKISEPLDVQIQATTAGNDITGGTYYVELTSSENLSGSTVYGAFIGNAGAESETTGTLPQCVKGMLVVFENTGGLWNGSASGATLVIQFNAADSITGLNANFSSGNSVVYLSGSTMTCKLVLEGRAANHWYVSSVTGEHYRNQ